MTGDAAMWVSSSWMALIATNSGIQVFPNWQTSGVESPANAVRSFSWAAVHGNCWTSTRTPGCARSNSGSNCATTSPSRPMAQKRTTVESRLDVLHAAVKSSAAASGASNLRSAPVEAFTAPSRASRQ